MIAQNEKDNIGPALDTILPIADEIIVNVNSTNDGTHEIVQKYAKETGIVKHWSYSWQDDFSLARNQSMEPARFPWILWLDADDRVPVESIEGIRELAKAPQDRCFQFRIRNGRTDGLSIGPEFYQIRMFPNLPTMRWEKRVHEQISIAAQRNNLKKIKVDVEIYHTGYMNLKLKQEKARRNLRLMEMDPPEWPIDYAHRAHAYVILGKPNKAIEWYMQAWNIPGIEKQNPDLYYSLPGDIGGQHMVLGDYETALGWFKKCDPDNIEGAYQAARCYEELERYHVAINMYYRALKLHKPALCVAMEYDACRIYTFQFLLRLLVRMRRHHDAVKLIADMTREYPQIQVEPDAV
jgi:tetratricopeptide (TPR) repeat protein